MGIHGNASNKQKKLDLSELSLIDEYVQEVDSPRNEKDSRAVETLTGCVEGETVTTSGTKSVRKARLKKQSLVNKKLAGTPVPKALVENIEEHLQAFLLQATGKSSSKVFDAISKHCKIIKFDKNKEILTRGEQNEYLFMIVEGQVDILSFDNLTTLATLSEGSVFGEVSLLFDIVCTANVKAFTDTTLVYLKKNDFLSLSDHSFENEDIIDWFVKQRYLPTGDCIDASRVYRRIAFSTLKDLCIPLFKHWPDNVIKSLILKCDHNLVLLYPKHSTLVIEGDPQDSLLVVVDGTVAITAKGKSVASIATSKSDAPFAFGESGILFGGRGQVEGVTISAVTSCKVMKIHREWIVDLAEKHTNLLDNLMENSLILQQFISSTRPLQPRFKGHLQFDLLFHNILSACHLTRKSAEAGELWEKLAEGNVKEYKKGEHIVEPNERERYGAFFVVQGMVVVQNHDNGVVTTTSLDGGEPSLLRQSDTKTEATGDTTLLLDTVVYINNVCMPVNETTRMVLNEGKVITVPAGNNSNVMLKAYTHCLVLKLKRMSGGEYKEVDQEKGETETEQENANEQAGLLEFV